MTFFFVGGAASQAGIKGGDHILEINGLNVRCSKSFIMNYPTLYLLVHTIYLTIGITYKL